MQDENITGGLPVTYADLIRRGANVESIARDYGILQQTDKNIRKSAEISIRYEGYIKKNLQVLEKAKKLESAALPNDINYSSIKGLRLEAAEKLDRIKPVDRKSVV